MRTSCLESTLSMFSWYHMQWCNNPQRDIGHFHRPAKDLPLVEASLDPTGDGPSVILFLNLKTTARLDDSKTVLSISRSLLSWSDLNWFSKFFFSMGFGTFLPFIAPALPKEINQWGLKGHVPPIFLCFTQKHIILKTSLGNQTLSDFLDMFELQTFWSTRERPAKSWFRKSRHNDI